MVRLFDKRHSEPAPIVGFVAISEPHLDPCSLILTCNYTAIATPLTYSFDPLHGISDLTTRGSAATAAERLPLFDSPLRPRGSGGSYAEQTRNFAKLSAQPLLAPADRKRLTFPEFLNEDMFKFLTAKLEEFRRTYMDKMLRFQQDSMTRLELIVTEFRRQYECVQDIRERLVDQKEKASQLSDRMEIYADRQEILKLRANTLLQIVVEQRESELTPFEKDYFEELAKKQRSFEEEIQPRIEKASDSVSRQGSQHITIISYSGALLW